MFLPYYITSSDVNALTLGRDVKYDFDAEYKQLSDTVRASITADMIEQKLIRGTKLQETWFATDNSFHVFLSHSHADEKQAKRFAAFLKQEHGINVFIDSCYWGYCNNLLKNLDNKICHYTDNNGKGWYNYDCRNFTTSLIHIMLANALLEMMSKTECVIFLNTHNSIKPESAFKYVEGQAITPSPWIYHEIAYANSLERQIPERWYDKLTYPQFRREGGTIRYFCCEALAEVPNVEFDVDFSKFHQLTSEFLLSISARTPEKFMDALHMAYINEEFLNSQEVQMLNEIQQRRSVVSRQKPDVGY